MSTTHTDTGPIETPAAQLHQYPGVALTFAYDDPESPSTVTVYPAAADDRTTWVSVDVEHAVSLDAMR
jgi:hypothetical protein